MIALFVQTLLLMGAAYFVGAALACVVRRSLFAVARPAASPAERRVDPLPEVAQRAARTRFGRGAEAETRLAPQPLAVAAPSEPAQDLKRIRQIDAGLETGLNKLGIRRYDEIAAWKQADVQRVSAALGLGRRIAKENWIEQAQVLARGGETYFATRRARGEAASAEPTPDEGEPRILAALEPNQPIPFAPRPSTRGASGVVAEVAMAAMPAAAPDAAPNVSERAAFAQQAGAPAAAVPIRPAAPATRDNLMRISGIDAEIDGLLLAQGVTRYSQIAHWSPADVARLEQQLGSAGRIGRENWIEQAQILSRGGDTKFSRAYDQGTQPDPASAPSPRPVKLAQAIQEHATKAGADAGRAARADIGALRSVRSEIYQNAEPGAEAAQRSPLQNRMLGPGAQNDLKRIRGIGVLIEKKLNSMGVLAYEQIANWTADDIERVSQSLDFKGRIERENWVEQARILASGGATEFSRRVDKGEVETSRYKT